MMEPVSLVHQSINVRMDWALERNPGRKGRVRQIGKVSRSMMMGTSQDVRKKTLIQNHFLRAAREMVLFFFIFIFLGFFANLSIYLGYLCCIRQVCGPGLVGRCQNAYKRCPGTWLMWGDFFYFLNFSFRIRNWPFFYYTYFVYFLKKGWQGKQINQSSIGWHSSRKSMSYQGRVFRRLLWSPQAQLEGWG